MKSHILQLFCLTLVVFTLVHFTNAQAQSTGSTNGIVSAAGSYATPTVSYTIQGSAPTLTSTSASSQSSNIDTAGPVTAQEGSSSSNGGGLSLPAILGITLGVVAVVVAIGAFLITTYLSKRRQLKEEQGKVKRRSIMDLEFAASKVDVRQMNEKPLPRPVSKPLPAINDPGHDDDNLSRSSTIIADAAEIAKINRKASTHQKRQKQQREVTRERNHALQILVSNENGVQESVQVPSPVDSNPVSPCSTISPSFQGECADNDGDAFSHRPSKI